MPYSRRSIIEIPGRGAIVLSDAEVSDPTRPMAGVRHQVILGEDLVFEEFDTAQAADDLVAGMNAAYGPGGTLDGADAEATLLDTDFAEVLADRQLLDQAARAVTMNFDCDYLGAIERLQGWAHNATLNGNATLRGAIDFSPIEVSDFDEDVRGLAGEAKLRDLDAQLADAADEDVDEQGRVRLADPDERARRLTDPVEFERAYQRHLDASGALGSEEGREAYREQYRLLLDSGIDPIASLERERRMADLEVRRVEDERRSLGRVDGELDRRARQRELNDRISDAQSELDRL